MNPNQEQFLTRAEDTNQFQSKYYELMAAIEERYPTISNKPEKDLSEDERQMSQQEIIEHDLRQVVQRQTMLDQIGQLCAFGIKRSSKAIKIFAELAGKPLDGSHIDLGDLTFSVRYDPEFNYAANDTYYRETADPKNPEKMLKVPVSYTPSYKELQESVESAKRVLSRARAAVHQRETSIEEDHPRMEDIREAPKYVVSLYYNKFDIEV